jgi:hypothetical protein
MLVGQLPAPIRVLVSLGGIHVGVGLAARRVVGGYQDELVETGPEHGRIDGLVGRGPGNLRLSIIRPANQLGPRPGYGRRQIGALVAKHRGQLFRRQRLRRP